jgi:hypothetical protein
VIKMAIVEGNGMAYTGDVAEYSTYTLHIGGRPVLDIAVNNTDPDLVIYVGVPSSVRAKVEHGIDTLIPTRGRAQKNLYPVGGDSETAPDALKERVTSRTVQSYVLPRIARLMADVYVPKVD